MVCCDFDVRQPILITFGGRCGQIIKYYTCNYYFLPVRASVRFTFKSCTWYNSAASTTFYRMLAQVSVKALHQVAGLTDRRLVHRFLRHSPNPTVLRMFVHRSGEMKCDVLRLRLRRLASKVRWDIAGEETDLQTTCIWGSEHVTYQKLSKSVVDVCWSYSKPKLAQFFDAPCMFHGRRPCACLRTSNYSFAWNESIRRM